MSTTEAANVVHADGKALFAVAEGKPDQQPDEATLSHIFSCEQCATALKEMRQGLSGLATGDRKPQLAEAALDATMEEMQAECSSYAVEDRAKSLIWKLLIVGGLLAIGMLWLKSSATSLF
jgi:anti-sigma factor ChrR (cupin superfamily)